MKYFFGIVGLALIGFIAYQLSGSADAELTETSLADSLFSVCRGDLNITVVEEGSLKAKNSIKMSCKFEREGIISWLIEEGAEVKEGDILVEFEKTDVQNEIHELETNLIQYETELEAAIAEKAIQERENTATIESAALQLEMSLKKLKRYKDGDAPNELRKKELAVKKANSDLKRAEERFSEVPALHEAGFLTKIQVEEETIKLEEAGINLESAQRDLELYNTYTDPMEIAQKEADIKDGERRLINANEKAEINLKERQARVSRQESKVTSTKNRLEKYRKELEQMTMKAPQPGIVHYGSSGREWEREYIKVGGRIWSGITVITLPDLSEMQLLCLIHEAEIDRIKKGMEATVTIEAIQGKIFKGAVTHIATVASSHWSDKSNKRFEVEITLEPSDVELRAGITAKAEIHVEKVPDVLMVPLHSVFTEEGERFCFLRENKEILKRDVEIGKNSTHFVQITSGLKEGEQVLLLDPRENGMYNSNGRKETDPPSPPEGKGDASKPLAAAPQDNDGS
ncbi:MAG: efflux RND transporter periplasmic adaptor subunit [Planctomycetota bacterium]